MFRENTLACNLFEELLGKDALHNCEERFNQHPHVVKIALLHAAPDAWSVSDHDGKRVEQHHADSAVFADYAEDRQNERPSFERAVVQIERLPPIFLSGVIERNTKVTAELGEVSGIISLIGPENFAMSCLVRRPESSTKIE